MLIYTVASCSNAVIGGQIARSRYSEPVLISYVQTLNYRLVSTTAYQMGLLHICVIRGTKITRVIASPRYSEPRYSGTLQ